MHLIKYIRCPRVLQIIRKYWLKSLIFLLIIFSITILYFQWKYNKELTRLNKVRTINMNKIQKMVPASIMVSEMSDTWRIPDVYRGRIFSAYLDLRPEVILEEVPNASSENLWALIRIIAILNTANSDLTCYYKFPSDNSFDSANKNLILESPAVAVRFVAKRENFGMRYSAAFVLCKLVMDNDGRLPLEVTISSSNGKTFRKSDGIDFIDIHYTTRITKLDQNRFMAVCVPSLHHNYDKSANLIEFVEFYRMMGVDHFTFYNTSVTPEVNRVLTYYKKLGVAKVIQWELPSHYVFEGTLRYNGIFAAINDCVYRNTFIGGFKYVVNVDLDEFIVPRKHKNFHEMMKFLDSDSDDSKYSVFLFRNMFFYLMHEDNPFPHHFPGMPKLLLDTKIKRWTEINPAYDRSKYIAKGQDIIEMGNHRVWQTRKTSLVFRTSFREVIVDPDIAGSHHYRYCEVNELVCWLRGTVVDTAADRFINPLGIKVMSVFKKLFNKDAK